MFKSLFIANRGEIALRIARTARDMGLDVVAVHASDEPDAPHTSGADAVVRLPGQGAAAYLDAEALIAAAILYVLYIVFGESLSLRGRQKEKQTAPDVVRRVEKIFVSHCHFGEFLCGLWVITRDDSTEIAREKDDIYL